MMYSALEQQNGATVRVGQKGEGGGGGGKGRGVGGGGGKVGVGGGGGGGRLLKATVPSFKTGSVFCRPRGW